MSVTNFPYLAKTAIVIRIDVRDDETSRMKGQWFQNPMVKD